MIKRSGMKTSEFFSILLFVIVIIANGTQWVNVPQEQVAMLAAAVFGYGGGRVLLKNTIAKKGGES